MGESAATWYLILSTLKQTDFLFLTQTWGSLRSYSVGTLFIAPPHSVEGTLSYNGYKFKSVDAWIRIEVYLYLSWYSNLPNFEQHLLLKSFLNLLVWRTTHWHNLRSIHWIYDLHMAGSTIILGDCNPRGKNKFLKKDNNKRENWMRKIKNVCTSVRNIFRFCQRGSFLFLIRLEKKIFQEMRREIFKKSVSKCYVLETSKLF